MDNEHLSEHFKNHVGNHYVKNNRIYLLIKNKTRNLKTVNHYVISFDH